MPARAAERSGDRTVGRAPRGCHGQRGVSDLTKAFWFGLAWPKTGYLWIALLLAMIGVCIQQLKGSWGKVDAALHEYYQNMPANELKRRIAEAAQDPELRHVLAELQRDGVHALAKYQGNDKLMLRLSAKMGGVPDEIWVHSGMSLHESAREGILPAVQNALNVTGAISIDTADDQRGMTALQYAAAYGHAAVSDLLVRARADPRTAEKHGNTVLHFAAGYGHKAVCDILSVILTSDDARKHNYNGQSPLDVAQINVVDTT